MKKIASKIVSLFMPELTAGACVADVGCCCNAKHTKKLNCLGACIRGGGCHTKGCWI